MHPTGQSSNEGRSRHIQPNLLLVGERSDVLDGVVIAFLAVDHGSQSAVLLRNAQHGCRLRYRSRDPPLRIGVPLDLFHERRLDCVCTSWEVIVIHHRLVDQRNAVVYLP